MKFGLQAIIHIPHTNLRTDLAFFKLGGARSGGGPAVNCPS